jgi:hypothetical protein
LVPRDVQIEWHCAWTEVQQMLTSGSSACSAERAWGILASTLMDEDKAHGGGARVLADSSMAAR